MKGILDIKDLKMYYRTSKGFVKAVDGVNLSIKKSSTVGLVGESGCGKTSIGLSILRLLPQNGEILHGKIFFEGKDLVPITEEEMCKIRWRGIAMIFQAAMNALNPVHRVEDQVIEAILAHEDIEKAKARERVKKLFKLVGLDPSRAGQYPHEYSGGMKQRAIIAMSLACNPKFIIADEPTTALDVILQDQIIGELKGIQHRLGMSMLYISHDISIIAQACDVIAVMYAGRIVELAGSEVLFNTPLHPYTQGLISSFPSIKGPLKRLMPIVGEPPDLIHLPSGCRFHPRCRFATSLCKKEEPAFEEILPNHSSACHYARRWA